MSGENDLESGLCCTYQGLDFMVSTRINLSLYICTSGETENPWICIVAKSNETTSILRESLAALDCTLLGVSYVVRKLSYHMSLPIFT